MRPHRPRKPGLDGKAERAGAYRVVGAVAELQTDVGGEEAVRARLEVPAYEAEGEERAPLDVREDLFHNRGES